MSLFFLVSVLLLSFQHTHAIDCMTLSSSGYGTCKGATYCTATWTQPNSSSPWHATSFGCVQSNVQSLQHMNQWWQPVLNQARFRCNHGLYCNRIEPPSNLSPPPPLLQCRSTLNNGTVGSCTASACGIARSNQKVTYFCDFGKSAFRGLSPRVDQFCMEYVVTSDNQTLYQGMNCYCTYFSNCNDPLLLDWGQRNKRPSVATCSNGPGNQGSAGQVCRLTRYKPSSGAATNFYYSLNTTMDWWLMPLGCFKLYGSLSRQATYTSCMCTKDYCNTPNTIPTAWPMPSTVPTTSWRPHTGSSWFPSGNATLRPLTTHRPWTTWRPHTSWKTTMKPPMPAVLMVLLEKFDNTAGGGQLFMKGRCDPFWFSGLDQCDMAIQVCVEPLNSDPAMLGCITKWIDLGQVTNNNNKALFNPGASYGGWTNPMTYPALPFIMARGFQVKYAVTDVDNGGRQLIDINICNVYLSKFAPGATISCQHQRPNGYPALLRLSYYVSMGHGPGPHPNPSHPTWHPWSQRPSWRPSPPWSPRPSWRPSGRPSFIADVELHEFDGFMPKIHA